MRVTRYQIAIILLLAISGAANGLMDALQFHGAWAQFGNIAFWNPDVSWTNKWAVGDEGQVLVGTERFWGSSRWFVGVTDGWHLAKFAQVFFIKCALILAMYCPASTKWLSGNTPTKKAFTIATWFIAASAALSVGFHIVYSLIF